MVSSWVDQWGAPARSQMVEGGYCWNIYFQVHLTQLPYPIPCHPLRLRAGWKKVEKDLERNGRCFLRIASINNTQFALTFPQFPKDVFLYLVLFKSEDKHSPSCLPSFIAVLSSLPLSSCLWFDNKNSKICPVGHPEFWIWPTASCGVFQPVSFFFLCKLIDLVLALTFFSLHV